MATRRTWALDGTFKIVPQWYQQLFTIHAFLAGKLVLAVYCLCTDKDIPTYGFILSKSGITGNPQLGPNANIIEPQWGQTFDLTLKQNLQSTASLASDLYCQHFGPPSRIPYVIKAMSKVKSLSLPKKLDLSNRRLIRLMDELDQLLEERAALRESKEHIRTSEEHYR
ncbi:hypothetical protein T09_1835 [Trichinella sp. T9]|nr:hypothetical protein T09_1835 [Trichinella sp. T9]